ncbi:MAG: PAS domain-containing protein [bacterium]|nr:PAS domain-containing protein [bacterium]
MSLKNMQIQQLENQLQKKETELNYYKNLINGLRELIYRADPETFSATYVNNAVEDIYGYTVAEWLSDPDLWTKAIHPDDKKRVVRILKKALKEKKDVSFEYRIIRKDRSIRWVENHACWQLDNDGIPVCINGMLYDITDRKLVEKEIFEEQFLLDTIIQSMPGLFYIFEKKTARFLRRNDNWSLVTGYSEEELDIMTALDVVVDRDLCKNRMQEVYEKGSSSMDGLLKTRTGKQIPYFFTGTRIYINSNTYLVGLGIDVSKRKHAEDAIIKEKLISNKKLTAINKIIEVFLEVSYENMYYEVLKIILNAMDSKFGIFGYLDEQGNLIVPSMTENVWDESNIDDKSVIFPKDQWCNHRWSRAIDEKKLYYINNISNHESEKNIKNIRHISLPIVQKNKSIGLIQVANKQSDYTQSDIELLEALGRVIAPVLDARLKQKKHQKLSAESAEKLEEEHRKLNSILENIPEVIYSAKPDETGTILYISDRWEEWTGYTPEECYKDNNIWPKSIHPDDKEKALIDFKNAIRNEESNFSEYRLVNKDTGEIRWVYDHRITITDRDGTLKRYEGIVTDITEHKNLEQQLMHSQKMEAISTLTRGMGHEFNNIIGIISGFAELMHTKENISDDDHLYLSQILKQTEKAGNLVKKINIFGSGKNYDFKPVLLHPVIEESMNLVRIMLPSLIEIQKDIDINSSCILGNADLIQQMIINMCNNSGYAMKDKGGTLAVTLKEIENTGSSKIKFDNDVKFFLDLCIKDTGNGILPDNLNKIFTPFFTTKNVGKGTGLGLSVVHGIVKNHKGIITVDSTVGFGTTFHVYLPVVMTQINETSQNNILKAGIKGREHVLLVEDESALARVYKLSLTKLGYKVTHAKNGLVALNILEKSPELFDIIFTDHIMPKMTGLDLSKAILDLKLNIPLILSTGYLNLLSENELHEYGISKILVKPVRIFELTQLVRNLIKNKLKD